MPRIAIAVSLVASLLACASCSSAEAQPKTSQPTTSQRIVQDFQPVHENPDVWLRELKEEARSKGISNATLDAAFKGWEPIPRVLELDRKQPEGTMTLEKYLSNTVPDRRVQRGRELYAENRALLEEIGRKYNVQPKFIVALWGVETDFGRNTGGFNIPHALATLAYDGRRSEFFRGELLDALKIINEGHISASDMKGSWAGALGQCQFMPSSFHRFAVDYDGDGHRNIWGSKADVFASIANYLSSSGWKGDESWGREVKLPAGFDESLADIKKVRKLTEWSHLGVATLSGGKLPDSDMDASLIYPSDRERHRAFVIYTNFKTLLKWNRSRYFALAVSQLADKIGGGH